MEDQQRFTVRRVPHRGGSESFWIFTPAGDMHKASLEMLKGHLPSTQQTYAYSLIDHLNWMLVNNKTEATVTWEDLQRYMNGLTGDTNGVYGPIWRRPEQNQLGASAANNVALVVKAYYLSQPKSANVSKEVIAELKAPRVAGGSGRSRRGTESNRLAPKKATRRPRFMPDEVVEALFMPGVLRTARDVMIVTWLHDGGLRVGGLCGLRFCDLHLVKDHPCGQRKEPHVHIVAREDNPNRARAKGYRGASISQDGYVLDGVIRAVSPDMISTYFAYMLDDFNAVKTLVTHEQVLVHTQGRTPGTALTTAAVRKLLQRACRRAGLDARVTPHAFRHKAAAAFYAASDFNAEMVAQEFGWANESMVTELYGKSANRHAMKYLNDAWDSTARPPVDSYLAISNTPASE